MKSPIRILFVLGFVVLLSLAGLAQISVRLSGSMREGPDGQYSATVTVDPTRIDVPFIKDAPYSGEEISEQTQVLADGTRITRPQPSTYVWRDLAGRTRTERPIFSGLPATTPASGMPFITEIFDPVTGYQYYVDTVNRVVHRCRPARTPVPSALGGLMSVSTAIPVAVRPGLAASAPKISSESLGSGVIEGIRAEGVRNTVTYPVGAMGNDRPIVTTTETWRSSELIVTVFTKSVDPRSGETVRALTKISRVEPDPGLFRIPSDYQVVDETGPFTLTINGTRK
jgi:hypothetical protein